MYTFEDVSEDHDIYVTFDADDTTTTVPKTVENLEKLIDHLVNGTPLDGDYDFNQDGRINGKDVILLEIMLNRSGNKQGSGKKRRLSADPLLRPRTILLLINPSRIFK